MEHRSLSRMKSFGISDQALKLVLDKVDDPRDRDRVSLVCKKWYHLDAMTRKHVTIAICYSTTPETLARRFPGLVSLKLKGMPRAAMFDLIPRDWGGYAGPWINEMVVSSDAFDCLRSLHLRRMIVSDGELRDFVKARGEKLEILKLDNCSGFSTAGLMDISRSCRKLKTLFLQESVIVDSRDGWLRALAENNGVLETLNFHLTELTVSSQDLELLARSCPLLKSLKISDCDISNLVDFFHSARKMEEFGGGSFCSDGNLEAARYDRISLPPRIRHLGLNYMGSNEMHVVFPCAGALKRLDLQFTFLTTEDHLELIRRCPNLEILEVLNVIGDRGLETVARFCKRLRRLRVERGDEDVKVTQRGLSSVARGCPLLEYLAVHVSDIDNAALESIGAFCKNLRDFRMVLLDTAGAMTESPLDNGVAALMRGCLELRRFALYLKQGGLTDVGMSYIGRYSGNIRYMLLGCVGESDEGLLELSRGCPCLQKLEMRSCCFSERALAIAVTRLASLRYLWVQSHTTFTTGRDLLAMARPFWNIEIIPAVNGNDSGDIDPNGPPQVLGYYSLVGQRKDCPQSVLPLYP